ncbi:MAG: ribosome-associated translation inhibitor RaiA [Thermotogaceae bacterium]|nr:ribosome-associated translation inhibitor RaiA [Thermotogaceae bacterium]
MEYKVIGRGVQISDAIKNYVKRRFEKIERVLNDGDVTSMEIRIEKDAENYVLKVVMNLKGYILTVEERNTDMYATIDFASDALEKQVKKLRDKSRARHKAGIKGLSETIAGEMVKPEYEPETPEEKITSVKRAPLTLMNVEEAVLQMDVMDHNFMVFKNAETGEVNVLYRKKDGEYGLLELFE